MLLLRILSSLLQQIRKVIVFEKPLPRLKLAIANVKVFGSELNPKST